MVTTVRDCRRIDRCTFRTSLSPPPPPFSNRCPKIVDSVLRSAALEKEDDEGFENRWSLIQHPWQKTVAKPSGCPIQAFQSGFLDASIEALQQFVLDRCGENGLGHDNEIYMDWLADDAFGVIDARTAQDDTMLVVARETVDAVQEAEVRVAWDKGLNTRGTSN